jgi:hypothetical protein
MARTFSPKLSKDSTAGLPVFPVAPVMTIMCFSLSAESACEFLVT